MTVLHEVVEPVTAGDPMSEQKWVRASLRHLSKRLGEAGHSASPPTVRRLLDDRGYRLHANTKQLEAGAAHPERDTQFQYIARQRQVFSVAGRPQISVDTKKTVFFARSQPVPPSERTSFTGSITSRAVRSGR
ncbi:MAG: hypothetical protein LC808_28450 [Actinobacteria bacterium]|nr:hypothetical protein [Actinomycetota bacterium]